MPSHGFNDPSGMFRSPTGLVIWVGQLLKSLFWQSFSEQLYRGVLKRNNLPKVSLLAGKWCSKKSLAWVCIFSFQWVTNFISRKVFAISWIQLCVVFPEPVTHTHNTHTSRKMSQIGTNSEQMCSCSAVKGTAVDSTLVCFLLSLLTSFWRIYFQK